jgi:hypothetical protein
MTVGAILEKDRRHVLTERRGTCWLRLRLWWRSLQADECAETYRGHSGDDHAASHAVLSRSYVPQRVCDNRKNERSASMSHSLSTYRREGGP